MTEASASGNAADPAALNRHQAGSVPPNRAGVANQINQPRGKEGMNMMHMYKVKFSYSMYEPVRANNKREAREQYIERMTKVMAGYGWDFDEECKKSIIVKCVK